MNKKIRYNFLLTALCLYFGTASPAMADSVSTPDPVIQIFPNIIINEVSFKDTAQDWIELYIKDDMNSGHGANIKGLKVSDDSVFFTITNDFTVQSGDFIVINFKSETENFTDSDNLITFNIKRTGLTGTTEQVVIKNPVNEIIDAVCWTNSTPTESEISDFAEIAEENQWSQNISSCISSESVPNNNSISRKTLIDTNTYTDWTVQPSATKGKTNISAVVQTSSTTGATPDPVNSNSSPFTSNNITNNEEIDIEESETATSVNTCESIYINEFLPNPEGADTGNEWIELFNPDEQCIMDGWIIDDLEGGSKPFYIYNKEVLSSGFLLLPSWETKISLNNSEDSVRLFNNSNEQKEKIDYKNAKENQSYAKNSENKFEWTLSITPLSKNLFMISQEDEEDDASVSKSSKSSTKAIIATGDLSENIFINEILPNPKGTDKGGEWIEIYNNSDEDINLGGWFLDLGEGSTKKYIFDKTTIKAHDYMVLSDTDMGISLKNTDGEIRLLDYEDKLLDSTNYESAAENSSYTKIKIISAAGEEYEWKWTTILTKGQENQTLYKFKGKITLLDEKSGSFELTLSENDEKITAKFIQAGDNPLTQELKIGSVTEMVFSKTESGEFILEDFQILQEPQEDADGSDTGIVYIILSSLPPAGVLGYFGVKKLGLIKFITS